jgi:hypothetical protein
VNPAYISAISVLCGSAIGALASLVTPRLAKRHENEMRRRRQENVRRERIFLEFIDLASHAFVDALVHTAIENPSKLVPLYATMEKLRVFASEETVAAAERVMHRVIETYYGPKLELTTRPPWTRVPTSFASSLKCVVPNCGRFLQPGGRRADCQMRPKMEF